MFSPDESACWSKGCGIEIFEEAVKCSEIVYAESLVENEPDAITANDDADKVVEDSRWATVLEHGTMERLLSGILDRWIAVVGRCRTTCFPLS